MVSPRHDERVAAVLDAQEASHSLLLTRQPEDRDGTAFVECVGPAHGSRQRQFCNNLRPRAPSGDFPQRGGRKVASGYFSRDDVEGSGLPGDHDLVR